MKSRILSLSLLLLALTTLPIIAAAPAASNRVKPVKNLILMIPDGTSLSTIAGARWYQWYVDPGKQSLAIDPYFCGTVRTHSSNAPIGDSAPTTSCYVTGYPSLTGFVATAPVSDPENDLYPTDPAKAYQPLATLLEAARMLQQKATGLVFTCEFPHATPADCSAHSYDRGRYDWIVPQMVHNGLDVVIGGGHSLLDELHEAYLKERGYAVHRDDLKALRTDPSEKIWSLFGEMDMAFDLDRDPEKEPSIAEMTQIAIEKLSKNENGFFLMVEGSKVDWAAHANDPVGLLTDYLAFDQACKVAFDYAKENGETVVVILSDHGNSGFSIGCDHMGSYDKRSLKELFGPVSRIKLTADGMAKRLNSEPASSVQQLFRDYAGFELNEEELTTLYNCKSYKNSPIPEADRSNKGVSPSLYSGSLSDFVAKLYTSKTYFGFTTHGHTAEDVMLAAYHPEGTVPTGMNTNIELHQYLASVMGLTNQLDLLTATCFVPHAELLEGYNWEIIPPSKEGESPILKVKNKKKYLTITPNTNIVKMGKRGQEEIELASVIVYVDRNNTFYLPRSLADYLK